MKSQFLLAFNEICREKNLPPDTVLEALTTALVSAYRRNSSVSSSQQVKAEIDPRTGEVAVYAEKEVSDSIIDSRTEIILEEARLLYPDAEIGDMVMAESTPRNFGRIAAQTAKQVILQRVREAERDHLFDEFSGREGEIVNGTVQSVSAGNITIGLGRTEAVLPRSQQVNGERYRAHDKIRVYILEVRRTNRGPQIFVSRNHRNLLRRLLELEVPEIYNGQVDIKSIAREAGARSKVAVQAMQPGVDPVGACVGMRGVRIQSIVRELNDEKIDVIEWDADPTSFIAKALSPARVSHVFLDDDPIDGRTATVIVPDDQLSLAIGREGQNARLAAKLTNWRIDIKSLTEAGRDSLNLLDQPAADPAVVANTELHALVEAVLEKKEAMRPITAEDYNNISKLVSAVEGKVIAARAAEHDAIRQAQADARKRVPVNFWKYDLEELNMPLSIHNMLLANNYTTCGDVSYQVELDPNKLLEIEGFGDASLQKVYERLADLQLNGPEGDYGDDEVDSAESATPSEEISDITLSRGAVAPPPVEGAAEPAAEAAEPVAEVAEPEAEPVAEVATSEPVVAETPAVIEEPPAPEAEPVVVVDDGPQPIKSIIDDLSQPLVPTPKKAAPEPKAPVVRVARATPKEEEVDAKEKKRKSKELIFNEEAGRVVAKKKRKKNRSRTAWDELNDEDDF